MINHLNSRRLDIGKYPALSYTDDVVVFPLFNLSGQMVGYQQYRPNGDKKFRRDPRLGKYFTKISKTDKTPMLAVWGLERYTQDDLYVTEGIFSACRLHNHGLNAIAVLANNPKYLMPWLFSLPNKTIGICDGDKAGKKLANCCDDSIMLDEGVYLDEMSDIEEIEFIRRL